MKLPMFPFAPNAAKVRLYLAGDSVTVADCTLQAILQFARVMKLDVLEGAPLLAEWSDRIRERPAAKATILL